MIIFKYKKITKILINITKIYCLCVISCDRLLYVSDRHRCQSIAIYTNLLQIDYNILLLIINIFIIFVI